ncbi:MAG TPA: hypothetical protein VFA09_26305 [Ktedonobacteraceae bacterium]|nr:hypothetical protein [Ktedonobacteraceae bacterium]
MSFTEDELQSFHDILEQRLAAQLRETERIIDERVDEFRHDIEQRILAVQQDTIRKLAQKVSEYQNVVDAVLNEKFRTQQRSLAEIISQDAEQREQQFENSVDRMLAAQLLGIEQLLVQQLSVQSLDESELPAGASQPQLEAIEVQTDLPWEDLMDVIGKALDERFAILSDSVQRTVKNLEQYLSVRLHNLRDEFLHSQSRPQSYNGSMTNIQEVLHGIEHLERIIESMQVAMTANNALLSNRLYHHQHLPLERAHPSNQAQIQSAMNTDMHTPLPIASEHVAQDKTAQVEEVKEE